MHLVIRESTTHLCTLRLPAGNFALLQCAGQLCRAVKVGKVRVFGFSASFAVEAVVRVHHLSNPSLQHFLLLPRRRRGTINHCVDRCGTSNASASLLAIVTALRVAMLAADVFSWGHFSADAIAALRQSKILHALLPTAVSEASAQRHQTYLCICK